MNPRIERVTHVRWPELPPDYSRNVQSRWDAIRPMYLLERNREQNRTRALALSAGRNNQAG
jgi:hypothetical protein